MICKTDQTAAAAFGIQKGYEGGRLCIFKITDKGMKSNDDYVMYRAGGYIENFDSTPVDHYLVTLSSSKP